MINAHTRRMRNAQCVYVASFALDSFQSVCLCVLHANRIAINWFLIKFKKWNTHKHTLEMLTPRRESLFAALQAEANQVCLGKTPVLCLSLSLSLPLPLYPKGNAIKKVASTIRNNLLASRAEISANKLALNLCVAQTNWSKAKQKPRTDWSPRATVGGSNRVGKKKSY